MIIFATQLLLSAAFLNITVEGGSNKLILFTTFNDLAVSDGGR